jgi:hypothetical protein
VLLPPALPPALSDGSCTAVGLIRVPVACSSESVSGAGAAIAAAGSVSVICLLLKLTPVTISAILIVPVTAFTAAALLVTAAVLTATSAPVCATADVVLGVAEASACTKAAGCLSVRVPAVDVAADETGVCTVLFATPGCATATDAAMLMLMLLVLLMLSLLLLLLLLLVLLQLPVAVGAAVVATAAGFTTAADVGGCASVGTTDGAQTGVSALAPKL